nr:tissue factor pathway inhibitor [Pogona vitticeps]
MLRKVRMGVLLAAITQLTFSFVACETTEASEDEYEYGDVVGPALAPLKLGMSICGKKADSGPCKALHTRYHFNILTRHCEIFNFGGCQGNENNFLTLEECQEKCVVSDLPEKKKRSKFKKEQPEFCLLENDPGVCRGLITRYFYNRESLKCEKFLYGGCLGNQNNFRSLKECQDTCQDTLPLSNGLKTEDDVVLFSRVNESTPLVEQEPLLLPSLCMMHMDRGLCRAQAKRFFYNYSTGKCRPFSYSGCGGNENNFTTRKSCLQMCKKGFFPKKRGMMKIRRKRKRQRVKLINDEIVIERI